MDYSAYHQQQGYDPSAQLQPQGYDLSAQPQQQGYDLSAQPQHFYNQSTADYYSYAYSNPEYVNNQPYPYHSVNVQPPQHQEQEPNPPGVNVQPPLQQDPNAYYQTLDYAAAAAAAYPVGAQQGGVDAGVAVAHQPIVQSSYTDTGAINGAPLPPGGTQTHLGLMPHFLGRPYRGRGRGRGRGRSFHKHVPKPAQDQTVFNKGGSSHVHVGPPQTTPHSYASSFGPTPMPFQGQPHPAPVLPSSKHSWCELCKVECNSIEMLTRHNSGKKHMKKLKSFEESQNVNSMAVGGQIGKMSVPETKLEVAFQPTEQIEAYANQQPQQESLSSQDFKEESRIAVGKGKVEDLKKPLRCELCKADCNSVEILNRHLNGKKHQKKLKTVDKSQNVNKIRQIEPSENQQLEHESLPSQGNNNEENKIAVEKQQVEVVETTEKTVKNMAVGGSGGVKRGLKRKMRGGKVGRSMRIRPLEPPKPKEVIPLVCELCNITCESQVVFQSHVVGKKHLTNAKRFLSENETLGQEVFQILRHAIQTFHEQSANASTSIASQLTHQGLLAQSMDFQAPTWETNMSQTQIVPANFGGPFVANAEGISEGRLVSNGTEIVATEGNVVRPETI